MPASNNSSIGVVCASCHQASLRMPTRCTTTASTSKTTSPRASPKIAPKLRSAGFKPAVAITLPNNQDTTAAANMLATNTRTNDKA